MSDNKKYYYLKLKENFFDSEEIKLLESVDNGYLYSNILLKLYLKSLKTEGKLIFRNKIPYNPKMIATVTGHNIDIIGKALDLFNEFGLIEILDNGTIFISDMQNFIGKSSTEADRIRSYREQIKKESSQILIESSTNVQQKNNKSTPELELELELKIEKELKIKKLCAFFEECWELYPEKKGKGKISEACKNKIFKLGEEFKRCIDRYSKAKPEWQGYQNGSTFFNKGYIDYLDVNYKAKTLEEEMKGLKRL